MLAVRGGGQEAVLKRLHGNSQLNSAAGAQRMAMQALGAVYGNVRGMRAQRLPQGHGFGDVV